MLSWARKGFRPQNRINVTFSGYISVKHSQLRFLMQWCCPKHLHSSAQRSCWTTQKSWHRGLTKTVFQYHLAYSLRPTKANIYYLTVSGSETPKSRGSNLRHSMDVANTWYNAIFELHGKFFPFVKLYRLVSVKTKQCRRRLTSHLNRIYNGHAQKYRCLYHNSPTNI